MSLMSWSLAGSLALAAAAPQRGEPSKCEPTDNRCKAELFVRRAKEAKSDEQRALYFNVAHRSYLALFDKTGDARHLCAARRMYDKSVAIKHQPAGQRASFEELLGDLTTRERKAGQRCERAAKPPDRDPPLLVAKEEATAPRPAEALQQASGTNERSVPREVADVSQRAGGDSTRAAGSAAAPSTKAEGPAPLPTAELDAKPRPPRGRIIGGASLLVAGAGFAGGMAGSLVARGGANAAILALDRQATAEGRELTADEHATIAAADLKYKNLTITAWVTGAALVASTAAGLALLAAPPRVVRHARLRVGPGELVLSF